MYAQKLAVHQRCKWKAVESGHTGFIYFIAVLDFAFLFEGEILGQVAAFMISAQEVDRFWVRYLKV